MAVNDQLCVNHSETNPENQAVSFHPEKGTEQFNIPVSCHKGQV